MAVVVSSGLEGALISGQLDCEIGDLTQAWTLAVNEKNHHRLALAGLVSLVVV
jgi:hypothetical protein